jgi:hypothetical protein
MKDHPILFSAPMVRALLDGSKTQTRRVVKPMHLPFVENLTANFLDGKWGERPMPYGQPGDRLWVREAWAPIRDGAKNAWYRADMCEATLNGAPPGFRWRPSIHMPRWASRITLEVTGVRVERLVDISEADAIREGVSADKYAYKGLDRAYSRAFSDLWENINGPGSWEANPWVWVIEFKRLEQPA